jgi:hypothetical protein
MTKYELVTMDKILEGYTACRFLEATGRVVKVGTSNTLPLIAVSLSHARDVGFCM